MLGQGFKTVLLAGVTGSGKTEVYLRLTRAALDQGLRVLVLVPEIALISQTERRFRARFGETVAVLHSGLSRGERYDQWLRIASGKAAIAIGARSCIFAPVENVGLIIVDEEHDASYKQEGGFDLQRQGPCRGPGPATMTPWPSWGRPPRSLQSWHNVTIGKYMKPPRSAAGSTVSRCRPSRPSTFRKAGTTGASAVTSPRSSSRKSAPPWTMATRP